MKKILAAINILIIAFVMLAASTKTYAAQAVQVSGNTTSLTVTRNVNKVTNPVTNKFTYTITPDANNPENGAQNVPTSLEIDFNAVAPDSTNTVTKTGTINFSGATFSKLGDYKFVVKEETSSDATTYPVSEDEYTIVVQVRNELQDGVPTGNLVATLVSQAITGEGENQKKSDIIFPSDSEFTHISLTKNVSGSLANTEEYFKFLVTVNGQQGDKYVISGQDASVTYKGNTITTSNEYVVGQQNYVYLKAGQTVTIGQTTAGLDQIKVGATYQIVEQEATDYQTYIDGSSTNSKDSGSKTTVAEATGNATTFVNNKDESALTGVLFSIAPFALILAIAMIAIVVFKKFFRQNEEY